MAQDLLVRWEVDSWFYRGRLCFESDGCYGIEYRGGHLHEKEADDLLFKSNSSLLEQQEGDHCLAPFVPTKEECFGPAVVEVANKRHLLLCFDQTADVHQVRSEDCFPLTRHRYLEITERIGRSQQALIGQSVLAFHCERMRFSRALVKSATSVARLFDVWRPNGAIERVSRGLILMRDMSRYGDVCSSRRGSTATAAAPSGSGVVAYDSDGIPMMRGDAVAAPCSGDPTGALAVSRIFNIDPTQNLSLVFEKDVKDVVPASKCHFLCPEQYRQVLRSMQEKVPKDLLRLPSQTSNSITTL